MPVLYNLSAIVAELLKGKKQARFMLTVLYCDSFYGKPMKTVVFLSCISYLTLSEAIGSLGCRSNSSDGSVLINQLTESQLLTSFETVDSNPVK